MKRTRSLRRIGNAALSLCALTAAAIAPGCAGDPAPASGVAANQVGKISLPLLTRSGNNTYRLSNVQLEIFGPQFIFLNSSDDPSETSLTATLETGNYQANLFNWTLEKDDGTGQFQPVPATLTSPSSVVFSIFNGTTSTITYQFQTDGVVVRVGTGDVKVVATVDEIPTVCTPFGAGCDEGAWCPPTGLTGAPLVCVTEGPASVGEPCASPRDCVASATCLDLGTGEGPLCTHLCPPSAFAMPCSSGGTCTQAAPDYGVCRP